MVLLEWATEEQQLTRPSLEEHGHLQKLGKSLTLLLHRLLLGHMLDEDFDAARIVRCPCCAVLCCLVLASGLENGERGGGEQPGLWRAGVCSTEHGGQGS